MNERTSASVRYRPIIGDRSILRGLKRVWQRNVSSSSTATSPTATRCCCWWHHRGGVAWRRGLGRRRDGGRPLPPSPSESRRPRRSRPEGQRSEVRGHHGVISWLLSIDLYPGFLHIWNFQIPYFFQTLISRLLGKKIQIICDIWVNSCALYKQIMQLIICFHYSECVGESGVSSANFYLNCL